MTTTFKPLFANAASITATGLASLGSTTADPPAGYELGDLDNSSLLYEDALLRGTIRTGTSPTASKQIVVCVYGVTWDGSTLFRPAGVTGSAGALTPAFAGCIGPPGLIMPIAIIPTNNTSDKDYAFGPLSVRAALLLDTLPYKWGVFVYHNTGVAFNATGGNFGMHWMGLQRQGV